MKDLVKIYKGLSPDDPNHQDISTKIQKITMLLLEEWQLDILLHVLNEDVFYDMLDIFRGIPFSYARHAHRAVFPMPTTGSSSPSTTHFINYFEFPQQMADIIKMRYKIMFMKDYIFCDHQKEEFLNYLNSVGRSLI